LEKLYKSMQNPLYAIRKVLTRCVKLTLEAYSDSVEENRDFSGGGSEEIREYLK
jgi:hypothetical protein